jgi:hypothetical protein
MPRVRHPVRALGVVVVLALAALAAAVIPSSGGPRRATHAGGAERAAARADPRPGAVGDTGGGADPRHGALGDTGGGGDPRPGALGDTGGGALPRAGAPLTGGGAPLAGAAGAGGRVSGTPVTVSVGAAPLGAPAPAGFLGLSFEVRDLPTLAADATRGDLPALLRSLGPGVLRFGGFSADERAVWRGPGGLTATARPPGWATTTIDAPDLAGVAALARETGWRVLLTVNLGHYDLPAAAGEAATAQRLLGASLAGIEIGNEPDLYPRKHLRPPGAGIGAYLPQAAAYRAAIAAAAPGVPIAGPDPSTGLSGLPWVRAAAATLHPALLTDHYYPLSSCGAHPTVSELMSPVVRRSESEVLARMVVLARAYRTPLRMDEVNDISCEGEPGVSDTFAAALWALDYTARALAAGTVGVNFHDLPAQPGAYSPLAALTPGAVAAGALHAQPEWYALLAAHALLGAGPGAQALPTHVAGAAPGELSAYAVRGSGGHLALLLVDYDPPGSPPLAVHLRLPRGVAGGTVLRLTAPGPAATAGVRLGGRAVAPDGTWAPGPLPAVSGRPGALAVQVAPSSAAVVALQGAR